MLIHPALDPGLHDYIGGVSPVPIGWLDDVFGS